MVTVEPGTRPGALQSTGPHCAHAQETGPLPVTLLPSFRRCGKAEDGRQVQASSRTADAFWGPLAAHLSQTPEFPSNPAPSAAPSKATQQTSAGTPHGRWPPHHRDPVIGNVGGHAPSGCPNPSLTPPFSPPDCLPHPLVPGHDPSPLPGLLLPSAKLSSLKHKWSLKTQDGWHASFLQPLYICCDPPPHGPKSQMQAKLRAPRCMPTCVHTACSVQTLRAV